MKALRFGPDDDVSKTTKVPILFVCKSSRGLTIAFVEVLQRSAVLETFESPQRPPISWGFDNSEPVLYGFSMDGKW